MASTYAIFSGLNDITSSPAEDVGINYFCQYNATTDDYFTTSNQHLTIDTPGFTSYTANGGLLTIDVDNQQCGSIWEQLVDQGEALNSRNRGPAGQIGDGGSFPAGHKGYQLGVVKEDVYAASNLRIMDVVSPSFLASTFTSSLGSGGEEYDLTNASLQPGHCYDKLLYSVIVPSTGQQETTGRQGRRIHFQCNQNTDVLADLLRKLQSTGQYDFPPTVAGGTIPIGADNEEAAGRWLVCGYGILAGPNLAFTAYDGP